MGRPAPRTRQGWRIATAAAEQHITLGQLARDIGMAPNSLSRIMTGEHVDTSASTIKRLARRLDVTTDYLLEMDCEEATP